jgi:hypothetical protein
VPGKNASAMLAFFLAGAGIPTKNHTFATSWSNCLTIASRTFCFRE